MYVALRGRQDMYPILSFLLLRVREPMIQDHAKLRRLIAYLCYIVDKILFIGVGNSYSMVTTIDISCATYDNYERYTGNVLLCSIGCISSKILNKS